MAWFIWEKGYQDVPESAMRIHVTGTASPSSKESCLANLVADSTSLRLFFRDSPTQTNVNQLFLTGVNVFDKDIWHISFGKKNRFRFTNAHLNLRFKFNNKK